MASSLLKPPVRFPRSGRQPISKRTPLGPHRERLLARGEFLFRAGEVAHTIFLIKSGEVSLTITNERGDEVETEIRGPGHYLGSEALVGLSHDVTAQAVSPCRLFIFNNPRCRSFGSKSDETSPPIVRDLLDDIHDLRLRLLNIATRSAIQRLAAYLLEKQVPGPTGGIVPLPWGSKTRLARYLAIRQETLSRLLVELAARGAIELYERGVHITSPEQLDEIVQ